MSQITRFEDAEPYLPPGHHGVVNRLLAGIDQGGVSQVSVWHGRLDPGGGAEPHAHESSLQIYVGVTGELAVSTADGAETTLEPGDAIVIPAGVEHDVGNRSQAVATLLVMSSPALR